MKQTRRFLITTMVLLMAYVLSACGGMPVASSAESAAVKVNASPVAYTGIVESIEGDQWVVNGQILTVDQAVVRDGPFHVGDVVKVEGDVNPDGSFNVSRVEAPSAEDLAELPQLGDDNTNENSNDDNSNDDNGNDNSNDDNSNDDNANDNSNDDDDDGNSNDDSDDDDNGNSGSNDDDEDDDDEDDDDDDEDDD